MKYLSRATQANVAILAIVMKWLHAYGPASYEDLAAAVRPSSMVSAADNALRATLDVASHIGLLGADTPEGEWALADREQPAHAFERHDLFRALVRRAVLRRAVSDAEAGEEPSDVAIGLTWLCSLDPSRPIPWGWDDGMEKVAGKVGLDEVITNKTQWGAFRRWATALGFGTGSRPTGNSLHRLIPDPTTAIAECLPQMQSSLAAREFVDALSTELPTVDGGALEGYLRGRGARYARYEARGEATLGPAVGRALERLQLRGTVTLHKTDDAGQRVSYRVAGQMRTFDHISIEIDA